MKTTRRQFIKGLLATAATAVIAPQVLVESVHGASNLTAQERDVVADVLGLKQKQWHGWDGIVPRFKRYMSLPVIDGRGGFGKILLSRDDGADGSLVPREIQKKVVEALGFPSRVSPDARSAALKILDFWVWKGDSENGDIFWTADMPSLESSIVNALNREWDKQFLEGTGIQEPLGVLSLDNEYDPEPIVFHVQFKTDEIVWRSRELNPDRDQGSPFIRL